MGNPMNDSSASGHSKYTVVVSAVEPVSPWTVLNAMGADTQSFGRPLLLFFGLDECMVE